jgi:transposase InsO family protein
MIWELRQDFKVSLLIDIAGISRSTYYDSIKRLNKEDKYKKVKEEIQFIFKENKGRYGYRRITQELRNRNYVINHKTVQRLMNELGLKCKVKIKKHRFFVGAESVAAENLLNRNFDAPKPNEKWVTDVTQFNLFGKILYLSVIMDLYCGYVVAYTISENLSLSMIIETLRKAFKTIPSGTNLIMHSDQGWQYQHRHFRSMLKEKGIRQSMSRKGNCLDNAAMESFFGLLKSELLYLQDFESADHFRKELEKYIDYYNNKRIKQKLNGMTPGEYRKQALTYA